LTFDLFDAATDKVPVTPSGTYTTGGRRSYPLHSYVDSGGDLTKVFYRVTGDDSLGTFQGTFVSVNGVDENRTTKKKFRVWQLGWQDTGRLLLDADLTDAYLTLCPPAPTTSLSSESRRRALLRAVLRPPTLGRSNRKFVRIGGNSNSSGILRCPMNGQFVDGCGYSFGCFERGELIRPTKYLNRLMRAWAASRHR
jgi:hypothetical protein